MDKILPNFSLGFQKKISSFIRWEDAQLSILGKILLIIGLRNMNFEFNETDLYFNKFNKPLFKNDFCRFNISHSSEMVVCIISNLCDVGVDIERMSPIDVADFTINMTKMEWKLLSNSINPINSFYNYWTQKEAVIKAHGDGFGIPLKSFEILDYKTKIKSDFFLLKELNVGNDYICHIAFKNVTILPEIELHGISISNLSNFKF